ncbi:hypothetical protein DM860_004408 [Cuscuta australis]|uniref:Uncharacterized protein n=1 Tax=Cuscuta australis TaxID=267555 RepID=A0A328E7R8_9ASTE|nr:hypothetical protein DM860_004408 [Cuscuta australis]
METRHLCPHQRTSSNLSGYLTSSPEKLQPGDEPAASSDYTLASLPGVKVCPASGQQRKTTTSSTINQRHDLGSGEKRTLQPPGSGDDEAA